MLFHCPRQVSGEFNLTYNSTVEFSCALPYVNALPDNEIQNSIVWQADGTWSYERLSLKCGPCNQGDDALNISNSVLEIQRDAGTQYGSTGLVRCEEHSILVGNDTASCESVDGKPTWVVDNARCLRFHWTDPEMVRYIITCCPCVITSRKQHSCCYVHALVIYYYRWSSTITRS